MIWKNKKIVFWSGFLFGLLPLFVNVLRYQVVLERELTPDIVYGNEAGSLLGLLLGIVYTYVFVFESKLGRGVLFFIGTLFGVVLCSGVLNFFELGFMHGIGVCVGGGIGFCFTYGFLSVINGILSVIKRSFLAVKTKFNNN